MKCYCFILLVTASLTCAAGGTFSNDDWGERFNTAGTKLVIKEARRSRIEGRTIVVYELFASGFPLNLKYSLWMRLVESSPQLAADALLNSDGRVVSRVADLAHGVAEDPINLKVFAGRGEPKELALISTDGKFRAFGQVIPFPLDSFNKGCHLSAVMTGANYRGVYIDTTGFLPAENLLVEARSDIQDIQKQDKATDQGTYEAALLPFIKGRRSGRLQFKIVAKSCEVAVEIPWGEGSYQVQ